MPGNRARLSRKYDFGKQAEGDGHEKKDASTAVKELCMKPLVLIFPLMFFLSGCLFTHWTEEERQQFKLACEEQETIPEGLILAGFSGFDREEIRSVNVEHIRDGQIIETFVVSPVFLKNYDSLPRIIYGTNITGHTIKPRDTLRFTVGQQDFTLSDFKMLMWPHFTMFSEGYGCVLGEVAVNGENKEYNRWFVKPGYRDYVGEMFRLPPDSDEYRLLVVGQIILYIDTFRTEVEVADGDLHGWASGVWDGLRTLGDNYVTPDTVDDTGLKLAEAEQLEKQMQIKWKSRDFESAIRDRKTAEIIALGVLKTRYAMFQEKLKSQTRQETGPVREQDVQSPASSSF
jgi:hypothetical protein